MEDCWSYLPNYSKDTEFLPLCCNKSQKNWVATVRANDSDGLFYLTGLSVSLCLCPKIERPLSELWDLCVSNGSHVTEQLILHFNLWPVRGTSSVLTSSPPQMFSKQLPVWSCEGSVSPHERLIQLGFPYWHPTGSHLLLWVHLRDDRSTSACFSFL